MQYLNRRRRKLQKTIEKDMEDLRFEHESLEMLRDCHVFQDAIHAYLPNAQLTEGERAKLRECLAVLCRGRLK